MQHTRTYRRALPLLLCICACSRDMVVVVNGEGISRAYFEQVLRIELMRYDPIVWRDKGRLAILKEQILDRLITEQALYQRAAKAGVNPTEEELAEVYNQFKGRYTEEDFQKMLGLKGIDYNDWKTLRRQRYMIERLAEKELKGGEDVTSAATEAYYREHKADFVEPESVHVRQIVTDSEATTRDLRDKITKGANFAQLAIQYSLTPDGKDGGDLGYITRGTFPAVFDQVCFRLPVGAMSDVVKSEYGYHLFKILDRRAGRVVPLAEAKPNIEALLREEAVSDKYETWGAAARQQARITVHKDALAKATVKDISTGIGDAKN